MRYNQLVTSRINAASGPESAMDRDRQLFKQYIGITMGVQYPPPYFVELHDGDPIYGVVKPAFDEMPTKSGIRRRAGKWSTAAKDSGR